MKSSVFFHFSFHVLNSTTYSLSFSHFETWDELRREENRETTSSFEFSLTFQSLVFHLSFFSDDDDHAACVKICKSTSDKRKRVRNSIVVFVDFIATHTHCVKFKWEAKKREEKVMLCLARKTWEKLNIQHRVIKLTGATFLSIVVILIWNLFQLLSTDCDSCSKSSQFKDERISAMLSIPYNLSKGSSWTFSMTLLSLHELYTFYWKSYVQKWQFCDNREKLYIGVQSGTIRLENLCSSMLYIRDIMAL